MDGPWLQNALFDFALCLPSSIIAWACVARSAGWLRNPADQPAWFRFIAVRSPQWGTSDPPVWAEIVFALLFWGLFNLQPIIVLFAWPYGWLGRLIPVAFFLAQGAWLLGMRRGIRRARASHRSAEAE
jgi:hypothetical protein